MKSIFAIHPAITENTENMLMKCVPHFLIHESHNVSISAMSSLFHSIVSKAKYEKFLCDLSVSHWSHYVSTANHYLKQFWRKHGDSKGYKSYQCIIKKDLSPFFELRFKWNSNFYVLPYLGSPLDLSQSTKVQSCIGLIMLHGLWFR